MFFDEIVMQNSDVNKTKTLALKTDTSTLKTKTKTPTLKTKQSIANIRATFYG